MLEIHTDKNKLIKHSTLLVDKHSDYTFITITHSAFTLQHVDIALYLPRTYKWEKEFYYNFLIIYYNQF